MKCVNHPAREAVAQCCKCKNLLCEECRILSTDGKSAICHNCYNSMYQNKSKYCKYCGAIIPEDAVVCPMCGRQVEQIIQNTPNIVINNDNHTVNTNTNVNRNTVGVQRTGKQKNKWVALLLCLFLGYFGAHKFYEEKLGMGILYFFTCGVFFIGVIIDAIALLGKPTIYYI